MMPTSQTVPLIPGAIVLNASSIVFPMLIILSPMFAAAARRNAVLSFRQNHSASAYGMFFIMCFLIVLLIPVLPPLRGGALFVPAMGFTSFRVLVDHVVVDILVEMVYTM